VVYPKIRITIPVYNEEKTVHSQIQKIINYIRHEKLNISITVVNNGSTDSTASILQIFESDPIINIINLSKKGVGLALRESWNESEKNEIIGYMDLDLSTDISNLNKILSVLENFDILTASRLESNSKVYNRKLTREIVSRVFNFLIKIVFRSRLKDHMCGFKFLKSDVYFQLKHQYKYSDDWFFLTELLVIAQKNKKSIYPLPVIWKDDPDSKVNIVFLSLSYIRSILRLRKYVKN